MVNTWRRASQGYRLVLRLYWPACRCYRVNEHEHGKPKGLLNFRNVRFGVCPALHPQRQVNQADKRSNRVLNSLSMSQDSSGIPGNPLALALRPPEPKSNQGASHRCQRWAAWPVPQGDAGVKGMF